MRVDILVLFLMLGFPECFQLFTTEYDAICRFVIYGLYYVEVCSLYAHFLESFYHKWVLNFVKRFSASFEMIIWFLSFSLLIWCITLIDLQILKNLCIHGIKPTWSWFMIFLICCWILFARIMLRYVPYMPTFWRVFIINGS